VSAAETEEEGERKSAEVALPGAGVAAVHGVWCRAGGAALLEHHRHASVAQSRRATPPIERKTHWPSSEDHAFQTKIEVSLRLQTASATARTEVSESVEAGEQQRHLLLLLTTEQRQPPRSVAELGTRSEKRSEAWT
jgi:hypothetical protein